MTPPLDLLMTIVRGLIAATLMLLIGLPTAHRIVSRHAPPIGTPAREAMAGWFARLPGLLAWFFLTCSLLRGALQLLSFVEPGEPIGSDLLHAVLLEGSWGGAWMVQTAAALLLLAGSWMWREHERRLAGLSSLLILVLVSAQTYLGHGMEEVWSGATGQVVHGLHLLGSGIWLGTLTVLMLTTVPSLRDPGSLATLAAIIRAYSTAARLGVGLVVGSGVIALWIYSAGHPLTIVSSTWGRLLVVKLLLVAGALGIGWWNWRIGTPALATGSATAAERMRRAISVELLLGAVILALTAWLIGSPLPSHGG